MSLLTRTLDLLMPPRASERVLRDIPNHGLLHYLNPHTSPVTAQHPFPITGLMSYAAIPVQAAIIEAKFHANVRAARLLGAVLTTYLANFPNTDPTLVKLMPVIIPIPLSEKRLRERGYNQVERVARYANLSTVRSDVLSRVRETLPQTSLGGRERRKNVAGCFKATLPLDISASYIILDDVTTTGATLAAAADALRAAGAQHVHLLALTH